VAADLFASLRKTRADVARARVFLALERLAPMRKQKRVVRHSGLRVVIDRPKGFVQEGTAPDGTKWERTFQVDYGYFDGTQGGDGEALDVYLGPDESAKDSYWVIQVGRDGAFDEYKVMLGFSSEGAARAMYLEHTPPEFLGAVATIPVDAVRALLGVEPGDVAKAMDAIAKATDVLLRAAYATPYVPEIIKDGVPDRVCRVVKAESTEEERTVLGVVLVPDDVDSQGDTYSKDEVRQTAHLYMTDYRNIGLQHKALINRVVKLVESYLAPVDFIVAGTKIVEGTWMMKTRIEDDELWKKIKQGELTGYSIAGFATKTPLA
jgi:hypothetical protein